MAFTAGAMKTWKNLAWEESFFHSGFWGFGAFSKNLLNAGQRASIKVSTMTRPQTMLMAPLLPSWLHCVTTRHALRPGLVKGWKVGKSFLLQPLHWAASPASLHHKLCIPAPQALHPPHHITHPPQLSTHWPLATRLPSQDISLPRRAA